MGLPAALYRMDNIERAWRWIKSNPDRGYKTYFGRHYPVYSIAEGPLLKAISDRLRKGTYVPAPSCKIFLPKASGILRNYTLLEIEDQIAYQAVANVIAEQMFHRVRPRYLKQVFGHLYAGKGSNWFYRKWSTGYAAFNKAAIEAHSAGNIFAASFDLTAFYDSIDHRVLQHFLEDFGVKREIVLSLQEWLSTWTGTEAQILQGHGIPQGPLSSGLIAETVLSHLDNHGWTKTGVTYLRYVDDIRLFAKTEQHLRAALIRLDHLSKDIGLFPQSSKISIHRVSNIFDELKSVSQPIDAVIRAEPVDQKKLFRKLVDLSPRYRVSDATRFKFLLAHAVPQAQLTERLWKILDHAPEFYDPVARYLGRSNRLPRNTSKEVVSRIVGENLYPAVAAAYLRSTQVNLHPGERSRAKTKLKALWAPKTRPPDFTVALGQWLFANDGLTHRQTTYASRYARSSWVRSSLILAASENVTDLSLRASIATNAVCDRSADPAVVGASIAGIDGVRPRIPKREMRYQGALILKEFGLIRRAKSGLCGVQMSLEQVLGWAPALNWKRFFGANYRHVERKIVECRGYAGSDATAWVLSLDVFNDYLLDALFRIDGSLGGYVLGKIGGATGSPSNAFRSKYPAVLRYAKAVHDKRYESDLAHPLVKGTRQHTGRIPFGFIKQSKSLLRRAIEELQHSGVV